MRNWKRELRERGARSRTDGTPEARELDRKTGKIITELDKVSHLHEPGAGGCAYGLSTGVWWARCGTCGKRIWSRRTQPVTWFDAKLRKP